MNPALTPTGDEIPPAASSEATKAQAALLDFMTNPDDRSKWRILEPNDMPTLRRLSQAAQIPLVIVHLNLRTLTETIRPLG